MGMESKVTWYSVTEKLPEDPHQLVIVLERGGKTPWYGYYRSDKTWRDDNFCSNMDVEYWCYFPAGPRS